MINKKSLALNEHLLNEGEHSSSMYWVQSGQLIVTKKRHGEDVVLGHIYEGELVGEISFLDREIGRAHV